MKALIAVSTLLAVGFWPSQALAYDGGPVAGGGAIEGTVTFKGAVPAPVKLPITQDQDICGKEARDAPTYQVSASGALKNAVVWIDAIKAGKPLPSAAKVGLNNTGCRFVPHVQAAVAGSRIDVKNSDDVLHNTHARLGKDRLTVFNVGLPILGQVSKQKLLQPGVVKVGCDAGHKWMSAYIHVFKHPYFAVTGADGKFSMKDVPPGDYTVKIWHEALGTRTATAKVAAGGAVRVKVAFSK